MTARQWLGTIVTLAVAAAPAVGGARQDADNRASRAYARAVELDAQGNPAAALSLLWEAAGLAPRDADIQNRLGEALERIGALDAAVAAYRQALSARPGFRKAANNLILALGKAGHGEEGVERARALVALAPDDPDRLFTLGLAQSEVNVADAIETFRRVIALAPKHVLARYNLALALKRTDRLDDALEELGRAIAIEPRPEAYYARGVIHWHKGDLDRAASALRDALDAEPRYADAYSTLGSILKGKGDWRGAATALRRAIALAPDQPASHYTLAQVLRAGGDERGARRELDEAERLRTRAQSEQEATVWTSAGIQKLDAGDLAGALDLFQRATAASDRYAPAFYQMGRALQGLGQHEAARRAFSRASALNPSLVAPREPQTP
jgi:tetratricopeptide (TPR) repeat protein